MKRKTDAAPKGDGNPFVMLETVDGKGKRGTIVTLTKSQADDLGAKVRPATARDLEIAGK
jgi:hypothetical protein